MLLQKTPDGFRGLPLNDSPEALEVGEVRFINFSDSRIAISLGDQQGMIPKGESHRYSLKTNESNRRLRLRIVRETPEQWVDYLSTSMKPRNTDIRLNILTRLRPGGAPGAPPVFETLNLRGNDLERPPQGWIRP